MKIFEFFRRQRITGKSPLPPIRTVRPPGEARAERRARLTKELEETGAFAVLSEPEDPFMDTGSLEIERDSDDMDDPYQTHSWEMDPDEGLRRVEDLKNVNRKKPKGSPDNPYDTIVTKKKGW